MYHSHLNYLQDKIILKHLLHVLIQSKIIKKIISKSTRYIAIAPPIEWPKITNDLTLSLISKDSKYRAWFSIVYARNSSGLDDKPNPIKSGIIQENLLR